jgi:hypothetical protein
MNITIIIYATAGFIQPAMGFVCSKVEKNQGHGTVGAGDEKISIIRQTFS